MLGLDKTLVTAPMYAGSSCFGKKGSQQTQTIFSALTFYSINQSWQKRRGLVPERTSLMVMVAKQHTFWNAIHAAFLV
jgi:hypothetical protein